MVPRPTAAAVYPGSSSSSIARNNSYSCSSSSSSVSYFHGQRRRAKQRRMNPSSSTAALITESLVFNYAPLSLTPSRVPLINSLDLQLRFLAPSDLPEIKRLCKEWFPIDYPDAWYNDITSNAKFYSVACVFHCRIIGLVVAEIKDYVLPKEDSEILAATFRSGTKICYILSLGVVKDFRNNGIASFMLDNLISHLTSGDNGDVRAIYLHVLTTNSQAISFYEHRGFRPHIFLPYYYNIKGKRKDGFTYVLYINGGHPPWSLLDYMVHCCQLVFLLNPWSLTRNAARKVNFAWFRFMPRLRQIAQSSTAVFS